MTHHLTPNTCVFVFGNPDLELDSLPLKILPDLRAALPTVDFIIKDPNEEWEAAEKIIILDTAVGIEQVTIFDNLENFRAAPRVSLHDFDALANLRLLWKLGKIKEIKIIAVPPDLDKKATLSEISDNVAAAIKHVERA